MTWSATSRPSPPTASRPTCCWCGRISRRPTRASLRRRWCSADPGKYTYASSGIGGAQHLLTAVFNAQAGLDALHVPFQGSGPAMAAFLGGQVDYAHRDPGRRPGRW